MAKIIIIIEDTDTKTESFEVKVLHFQTPEERVVADTAAIEVGNHVAAALANSMAKLNAKKTTLPMQSIAHH
jgi:hypothetical protein